MTFNVTVITTNRAKVGLILPV